MVGFPHASVLAVEVARQVAGATATFYCDSAQLAEACAMAHPIFPVLSFHLWGYIYSGKVFPSPGSL